LGEGPRRVKTMRTLVGAKSIIRAQPSEVRVPELGLFHCGTESVAGTIFETWNLLTSRDYGQSIEFAGLSSHQILCRMASSVH